MKWKLRTKILLSVGVLIFIVLGITTLMHFQHLKQGYLDALKWLSEAPAKCLTSELVRLADEETLTTALEPVLQQCQTLYHLNEGNKISHLAILDASGKILAHTDKERIGSSLEQSSVMDRLKRHTHTVALDGSTYHVLVPVSSDQGEYLATIDIGVSKEVVEGNVNAMLWQSVMLFIGVLIFSLLVLSFLLHRFITKPIGRLVTVGEQLATGQLVQSFQTAGWRDEISALGTAFHRVTRYLHHVAEMASHISTGVLRGGVQIRSEQDVLGNALYKMLEYLKYIATIAKRISEGDLTEDVQVRSEDDKFGQAIQTMTKGLRVLIEQIKQCADQISSTGALISSLSTHDHSVIQDVHNEIENMASTLQHISTSVDTVVQDMETLSSSVQQSSDSVFLITSSITLIASNAEELTTRSQLTIEALKNAVRGLEKVSEKTDTSARLSQTTIEDALAGQQAFEQVMDSMSTIEQTITTAVDSITGFAERSRDIDRVLEVIREIMERTTLLALNAAIIAAQAGAHGRGFAVVADEIKNLAEGVNVSTKDIASIVQTLQEDTNKVVETIHEGAANVKQGMSRTKQAQEMLEKIIGSAQRSSSVATDIAGALHDVMSTGRRVVGAMEEVGAMTEDFTSAASEQEMNTDQINKEILNINTLTSQVFEETSQQLTGLQKILDVAHDIIALAEQSLQSSQKITGTTEDLSSQANLLLNSVERFKLEE